MAKPKYEKWLEPENLILLEGWRRDGLTHEQIAHNMGINPCTLYEYIKTQPKISEALKKGDEVCMYEVENAMYKSALGYYVEEIEIIETESDSQGKTVTKKKHRRYIPPSTANQIFIQKNRRPDRWKDSRVIETKSDGQLAALINGLKEPEQAQEADEQ